MSTTHEIKKDESCTSAHPLCHHGADRHGFTFYILLDLLNDAVTSSDFIASDSRMSIE
jgi:hypothetical protein